MNYLGIDVSKAKLDCALLREAGTAKRLDKTFTNDTVGVKALLAWLDNKPVSYTHLDVYKRQSAARRAISFRRFRACDGASSIGTRISPANVAL